MDVAPHAGQRSAIPRIAARTFPSSGPDPVVVRLSMGAVGVVSSSGLLSEVPLGIMPFAANGCRPREPPPATGVDLVLTLIARLSGGDGGGGWVAAQASASPIAFPSNGPVRLNARHAISLDGMLEVMPPSPGDPRSCG